jgi:hypothetical protein
MAFVVGVERFLLVVLVCVELLLAAVQISGFTPSSSSSSSSFGVSRKTTTTSTNVPHLYARRRSTSRGDDNSSYDYYDSYYDQKGGDDDDRDAVGRGVQTEDEYYSEEEDERRDSNIPRSDDTRVAVEEGRRGGMFKVRFDPSAEIDQRKEIQLDWEVCADEENNEALVLLPPEAVDRPTAVLHFVGGTFFGSLPKVWYRSLLEGLVRNTQCAVVVTPIPVTLLKSPLQHITLSRKLKSAFENAWTTVLEDEYGDLSDIPLCGCGHSLGARLMVVMTTLTQNKAIQESSSIPPYKSFVLISFTNYGAAAGIPGVSTLLRQSKMQEKTAQTTRARSKRKSARKAREDWWIDDEYNDNTPEEAEEDEWEELVDDLQELLKEQAARVRKALTPDSKDLEFTPSPDMLWKALEKDNRYRVPKTLVVQFDDDTIDQSSKLAQILRETNSSDVHFARLRGAHLTPVSVEDEGTDTVGWLGISSKMTTAVWKAIKGRGKTRAQEMAMRDLRQSISRYISDVVTK